jgi:hypothetical protein
MQQTPKSELSFGGCVFCSHHHASSLVRTRLSLDNVHLKATSTIQIILESGFAPIATLI